MRYRILGVTTAEDERGAVIPVGGPRLRALLTALALRPSRVATPQTLIDEVWADEPPQDAPAALQALIGRLRRALGKDAVTSETGGYRLAADQDDIDLFVFERLVRQGTDALTGNDPALAERHLDAALALWRGPALADLPDRAAAARPEARRLEAIRSRAEARIRLGRGPEVVPELRELTAVHPYDEPLHALLIQALRDTGRTADALAAYETALRCLAEGLGTDPGPRLRALHAELLDSGPRDGKAPSAPPERERMRPGALRPRLTSFVGREPEIDAIRSETHRARLVTLTGPGGSGKTRLAEEAAAGHPQARLAELAPLDRPEAVPGAVVSALGLRETVLMAGELTAVQDDPVALLVEYCAQRSLLLILDNCEHVIGAAAHLAETLLTRCPELTILATSREPLGVPGESVRPVEPLPPDHARRLFAERAAAVRPDAADAVVRDERAVAEICRRLDGLPLAIELAAARLRLLTPRQIADRAGTIPGGRGRGPASGGEGEGVGSPGRTTDDDGGEEGADSACSFGLSLPASAITTAATTPTATPPAAIPAFTGAPSPSEAAPPAEPPPAAPAAPAAPAPPAMKPAAFAYPAAPNQPMTATGTTAGMPPATSSICSAASRHFAHSSRCLRSPRSARVRSRPRA